MSVAQAKNPATKQRRSVRTLLRPLDELARGSDHLFAAHLPFQDLMGIQGFLPKFLFAGPGDRGSYLRVGIFAGIHGDEESGVQAIAELIQHLQREPERARGYELYLYPICNLYGYREDTRWSRSGLDLNREFWKGSEEIEVKLLEAQLRKLHFDGLIALHSDDCSNGLYGFVKGHELTHYVLDPALDSASEFLPRNFEKSIDNFEANDGIIVQGYEGILTAPPEQKPKPFEIVFETPQRAPMEQQIQAHIAAVQTILDRFKVLISEAQNI